MARPVKDGISILIGAGLGVGLMYLLDPEVGAQRRARIEKKARKRVSRAQKLARGLADSGMDHLHEVTDKVSGFNLGRLSSLAAPAISAAKDAYGHLGSQLHGLHSDAKSHAADALDDLKSHGADAADDAQSRLAALKSKLASQLHDKVDELSGPAKKKYAKLLRDKTLEYGRAEDHHVIGQTACAVGSLAIGAAAVYFFDPDKGHDRRDKVASAVTSSVSEVGRFFRNIGTSFAQRGQAYVDRGQEVAQNLKEQATDKVNDVIQKGVEIRDNYLSSDSETYENPSTTTNS